MQHFPDPAHASLNASAEFREPLGTQNTADQSGYHAPSLKELSVRYGNRKFDEFDDRRKGLALSRQRLIDLWHKKEAKAGRKPFKRSDA